MLEEQALEYIDEVLGEQLELNELTGSELQGLPLFLINSYRYYSCELYGRQLVLLAVPSDAESFTPAELSRQINRIQEHLNKSVVLLMESIQAYKRNRLVKMGVPFIVAKRQMFMPQLMIDLRERFPQRNKTDADDLSMPAQLTILYHLQAENLSACSLSEVADCIGYSKMTITKVRHELQDLGLCDTVTSGRSKHLEFSHAGRELWERARPYLNSPVRSVKSVAAASPGVLNIYSGLSALAAYTQINPDEIPTFALKDDVFRRELKSDRIAVARGKDEAVSRVELWAYDPALISSKSKHSEGSMSRDKNIDCVDILSLCLSLQSDPNERIQSAVNKLIKNRQWL